MKKLYCLISIFPLLALGQSTDQNHIKTVLYKQETSSAIPMPSAEQATQNITYFDGLGRPIQAVAVGQSATGKDIVKHIEYDAYGRQPREYLPYASTSASLAYRPDAATAVGSFYSTPNQQLMPGLEPTAYPFSEKLFEPSPLNRVLKQASPGETWALGAGHEIVMEYQANIASDQVKIIRANAGAVVSGYYSPSLVQGGAYALGELYKTITKDENWTSGNANANANTTEEFKDKEGRLILKRTYGESMIGNTLSFTKHDTYYAYDQYGNLTYVIPPMQTSTVSPDALNAMCYQYRYDHRNRLVEKKLPGKSWEYIVYDNLDRVIATGPAQSPFSDIIGNGWLFTKYDAFGRLVVTGWVPAVISTSSRNTLQAARNVQTTNLHAIKIATSTNTTANGVAFRYSMPGWPTVSSYHVLSVNYYDDYNFPDAPATFPNVENEPVYYNSTIKPKGIPTGSWVRVLESSADTRHDLSYTFYDSKARPIRTHTRNYLGGHTQADSRLDFSGKTLYTVTRHKRTASSTELYVKDSFIYTAQDRLEAHVHQVGASGVPQLLSKNTYDELGQLISKRVGGTDLSGNAPLQKADYRYNIRGWLKQINDPDSLLEQGAPADLFAFRINYDTPANTAGTIGAPLFNGNISETSWKTGSDNMARSYGYGYDAMNRLRQAVYHKEGSPTGSYNEGMKYDRNGNIKSMLRTGDLDYEFMSIEIDDLEYAYDSGNRLLKVTDSSIHPAGFLDGADTAQEYGYDAFGNMTRDDNKGIASIAYNHLDLPVEISFSGTPVRKINYLYRADGTKAGKTVAKGTETTVTDYLSGFQYRSGTIDFFPTAEGYVRNINLDSGTPGSEIMGTSFVYVFNYTDHLGNIRLSYSRGKNGIPSILEENHYYPFGLKHEKYGEDQYYHVPVAGTGGYNTGGVEIQEMPAGMRRSYQYKFQSQEFQDELGLNAYFFKYRTYYPDLGRFLQIDPVAESYVYNSTYAFAENRVVESIDLEGKESWYTQDGSLATKSGPLSDKYRSKNNLYSPSELQQLEARSESYTGPTLSQDNRTFAQRKENNDKWRKYYNDLEATKEAVRNHDNLGSPYTQKSVMEGVAYGMADMATGEIIGKLFQGAKIYFSAAKAEKTIVVIGEGMGRVQGAKSALLENGVKNVEVFQPKPEAIAEWNALTSGGQHLSDDVVKNTLLYKENVNWIKNATESGKTILDIGNDGRAIESTFYKMEKQAVYGN